MPPATASTKNLRRAKMLSPLSELLVGREPGQFHGREHQTPLQFPLLNSKPWNEDRGIAAVIEKLRPRSQRPHHDSIERDAGRQIACSLGARTGPGRAARE